MNKRYSYEIKEGAINENGKWLGCGNAVGIDDIIESMQKIKERERQEDLDSEAMAQVKKSMAYTEAWVWKSAGEDMDKRSKEIKKENSNE